MKISASLEEKVVFRFASTGSWHHCLYSGGGERTTSHNCDLREEAFSEGYTAMSRRPSSRFHLYHVCHLQQHQSRALHSGASASLQTQVQYSRDKC